MERATAEQWMLEALAEARKAESAGEIPVGAIVLINDKIVGRGHNHSVHLHDPSAHAEILALRQAARNMKNYRLPGSILIVTVEPCVMCAGAMIQGRIARLVYGCDDPKGGAVRSCFEVLTNPKLNHQVAFTPGVLAEECAAVLQSFFAARR